MRLSAGDFLRGITKRTFGDLLLGLGPCYDLRYTKFMVTAITTLTYKKEKIDGSVI